MNTIDLKDLLLNHPLTSIISGPTSSGKTFLTRRLISSWKDISTCRRKRVKCLWCYGQHQMLFEQPIRGVDIIYNEGMVDKEELVRLRPNIIVIDDLMLEMSKSVEMSILFTRTSHHMGVSVIFIVQNIFCQGKEMRNISLNSHYLFLLRNPRDESQIESLGRQLFRRGKINYFLDAYDMATERRYSYLMIDLHPKRNRKLILRSHILKGENVKGKLSPIIYLPK